MMDDDSSDSCILTYSEIVPLDLRNCSNFKYVKQEPVHVKVYIYRSLIYLDLITVFAGYFTCYYFLFDIFYADFFSKRTKAVKDYILYTILYIGNYLVFYGDYLHE